MKIKMNSIAKRQTADSNFAHFDGTWEELESLTEQHFDSWIAGYREGVFLITVPPENFFTSIVEVDGYTPLSAKFNARQEGEASYVSVSASGEHKAEAKSVKIVLYSHAALAENKEQSTDADWEIVSINASPDADDVPMPPMTRARNNLCMVGGTDSKFNELDRDGLIKLVIEMSEEIVFWNTHVQMGDVQ